MRAKIVIHITSRRVARVRSQDVGRGERNIDEGHRAHRQRGKHQVHNSASRCLESQTQRHNSSKYQAVTSRLSLRARLGITKKSPLGALIQDGNRGNDGGKVMEGGETLARLRQGSEDEWLTLGWSPDLPISFREARMGDLKKIAHSVHTR